VIELDFVGTLAAAGLVQALGDREPRAFFCVARFMGKDYDAAVMASGFVGFMLGTTANAMANMGALTERYGPAPRAYLVAPMVGAFFIDFTNALIITAFLNIWK
jgi:ESS family glutamate:Na+ symporter